MNLTPFAAVAASGFSDPSEQWDYSIKRFTGFLGTLMSPFTRLFLLMKFKREAHLSAVSGINARDIPVLVLQGTEDEFYGNVSSIYQHRNEIRNPKCQFRVMNDTNKHGHWDYLFSDAALEYRRKETDDAFYNSKENRFRAFELNGALFDEINLFLKQALQALFQNTAYNPDSGRNASL